MRSPSRFLEGNQLASRVRREGADNELTNAAVRVARVGAECDAVGRRRPGEELGRVDEAAVVEPPLEFVPPADRQPTDGECELGTGLCRSSAHPGGQEYLVSCGQAGERGKRGDDTSG